MVASVGTHALSGWANSTIKDYNVIATSNAKIFLYDKCWICCYVNTDTSVLHYLWLNY